MSDVGAMDVLRDILAPGLSVVFCGTAVGECAAARGHYYAGPGNGFWRLLHDAGLTPRRLAPDEDATMPSYGYGLTDLVKVVARSRHHNRRLAFDVPSVVGNVERYRPRWLAFTSKTAGQAAAWGLGLPAPGLGPAGWRVAGSAVFVLPSPSGVNRRRDYDGRPTRVEWWAELAQLVQAEDALPVRRRGTVRR